MIKHSVLPLLISLLASSSALATLPIYGQPELLARANGPSTYHLPPMTFLSNATPVINAQGDVAFKVVAIEGETTQGLWYKSAADNEGRIVFRAPLEKVVSDPALNDRGEMVFSVFEDHTSEGLFLYESVSSQTRKILENDNTELVAHVYPTLLNSGEVLFRGTHLSDDHSYFHLKDGLQKVLSEGEQTETFKASYLFAPAVNNQGQIAFKIRLGNKGDWTPNFPDAIVLRNQDGRYSVLARDQKTDPSSPFIAFDNSVALSEQGHVAFVATLASGKKTLVLQEGPRQRFLATEGEDDISELELFSPKVNSQGLVLFRAKNAKGERGLYLSDGSEKKRLLGENEELPTDLGPGRVWADAVYAAFSGGVNLNDRNELTFHTLVISAETGEEWGSAIYKLSPQRPLLN